MSPFEYGLQRIFGPFLGRPGPGIAGPVAPRQVPPISAAPPVQVANAGTPQATASGVQAPQPVTDPGYARRPQEDALDRFERIARLVELGERIGAGWNKAPYEVISRGGGVAQPQLPSAAQYGLSFGQ